MAKREPIVRYTADEVRTKVAMGESRTDWQRVNTTTEAEIERQARDDETSDEWCSEAVIPGLPPQKTPVNIRLDHDIVDFFKNLGPGYQTRINAVLRTFVEHRRAKS